MHAGRFAIVALAGFVAMFAVNALLAVAVIDPLFGDEYPELTGEGAAFDIAPLAGGYLLIAVAIAAVYRAAPRGPWPAAGLRAGGLVAVASFGGVHLVQAGYTLTDNTAWILSGAIDMAGPVVAGLVAAFVASRLGAPAAPAERIAGELERAADRPSRADRVERQIAELDAVAATIARHTRRLRERLGPARSVPGHEEVGP